MYSSKFEPAVKIDENFGVFTTSGKLKYFRCVYLEPLPASIDLIHDFGSINADSVSRSQKITILEMEGSAKNETDLSEVAQLRVYPIDDITVSIKQPSAQGRFKTRSNEIRLDYNTPVLDPTLATTEVYIYEDDTLFADVYNTTQYDMTKTRIQFFGYRIVGEQIDIPEKLTYLAASGFQG